jgi:hypothetical protein
MVSGMPVTFWGGVDYPLEMALEPAGNVYVADYIITRLKNIRLKTNSSGRIQEAWCIIQRRFP